MLIRIVSDLFVSFILYSSNVVAGCVSRTITSYDAELLDANSNKWIPVDHHVATVTEEACGINKKRNARIRAAGAASSKLFDIWYDDFVMDIYWHILTDLCSKKEYEFIKLRTTAKTGLKVGKTEMTSQKRNLPSHSSCGPSDFGNF